MFGRGDGRSNMTKFKFPYQIVVLILCARIHLGFSFAENVLSGKNIVVVGGGPVGLYFASLILHKDPSLNIEILEKKVTTAVNAFGLGISKRMQHRLSDLSGLNERVVSVGAPVESIGIPLVSRDDLIKEMSSHLIEKTNCKLTIGESCESVDLGKREITTNTGRKIQYDLLLAADGVNSKIRRQLVDQHGFQEEHYLEDSSWKVLTLPKQSDIESGSFKPLQDPSFGGRVLPRAPEGHSILLFWKRNGSNNPDGIHTAQDLRLRITEALQDKKSRADPIRKIIGLQTGQNIDRDRKVVFDEKALEKCFNARAGISHHLQVSKFHYQDSVALIGDSAHALNSLLGQGCALGFESARVLVESITSSTTLSDALSNYTKVASVEARALTELSLINYAMQIKGIKGKLKLLFLIPSILWNVVRGKGLIKRIGDITIPFSQILSENKRLLKLCRSEFEKKRIPFSSNSF